MSDGLIPLQYLELYNYTYEDGDEVGTITLDVPEILNNSAIKVQLSEDGNFININFSEDYPHVVCGHLYSKVTSFETAIEKNKYCVKLHKDPAGEKKWFLLITSNHSENKVIDPKSAYAIFKLYAMTAQETNDTSNVEIAFQYLKFAASCGYVPATREYATRLLQNSATFVNGVELLKLCYDKYKDIPSCFQLGIIFSQSKETVENGLPFMTVAAEAGYFDAIVGLGEYFSPLSSIPYQKKDAEKAVEYFKLALTKGEDWIALHELAKLTFFGIGTKQDTNAGIDLQRKAKAINPDVPAIELNDPRVNQYKQIVEDEKTSATPWSTRGAIIGASVAVASGFGLLVYKALTRKGK